MPKYEEDITCHGDNSDGVRYDVELFSLKKMQGIFLFLFFFYIVEYFFRVFF